MRLSFLTSVIVFIAAPAWAAEEGHWSANARYFTTFGDDAHYSGSSRAGMSKEFPDEFRRHNGAIDGGELDIAWSMRCFSRPSFSLTVRSGLEYSYREAGFTTRDRFGTLIVFLPPFDFDSGRRHGTLSFVPIYEHRRVTIQENALSAFGEVEARVGRESFGLFAKTGIKTGVVSRSTLVETEIPNTTYPPLRMRDSELLGVVTGYWAAGLRFSPVKRLDISTGVYGEWFDKNAEFRPTLSYFAGLSMAF